MSEGRINEAMRDAIREAFAEDRPVTILDTMQASSKRAAFYFRQLFIIFAQDVIGFLRRLS